MSPRVARASEQIVEPVDAAAISMIACASLGEDAAKPASMTSTRRAASAFAMRNLASGDIEKPGACSPSRSVVSKDPDLSHA